MYLSTPRGRWTLSNVTSRANDVQNVYPVRTLYMYLYMMTRT